MSDAIQPRLSPTMEVEISKAAHDVAPLYAANRWKWGMIGDDAIPNETRLRYLLRCLTLDLLRLKLERVGSGRLSVSRVWDGPDSSSLVFALELGEVVEGSPE
jgi:hypothetical protein